MSVDLTGGQKSTISLIVNSASRLKGYFDAIVSNIDSALNTKLDKSGGTIDGNLVIQDPGDCSLTIKSTGGGTDDDARLQLDANGTGGESEIIFSTENVENGRIAYFKEGEQLNIGTTSGDIDIQPGGTVVLKSKSDEIIAYQPVTFQAGVNSAYSSDWIAVINNNRYDFTHNLGLAGDNLIVTVFIKDSSGRIFQIPAGYSNSTSNEVGPSIYHKSTNIVQIATGNDGIYAYDNTELSSSVTLITSGSIKVKIQVLL